MSDDLNNSKYVNFPRRKGGSEARVGETGKDLRNSAHWAIGPAIVLAYPATHYQSGLAQYSVSAPSFSFARRGGRRSRSVCRGSRRGRRPTLPYW